MARVVERREIASKGLVADPYALGSVPASLDGQIVPVTDQPGINLWVRKSGTLVPAVDATATAKIKTTEQINMEVDYATGVSPPVGTTITSQAEYDALGAPLKFAQDALEILPPVLTKLVKVKLLAGSQYAKPDLYGFGYTFGLYYNPRLAVASKAFSDDPGYYFTRSIVFYSDDATREADQAGTVLSNRIVSRSSGTWTTDQHRGKLCLFTSGANAGTKSVIAANSVTQLTLVGYPLSSGACTFTIIEPAATLYDHEFGATNGAGIYIEGPASGGYLLFSGIAFGSSTDRLSYGIQCDHGPEILFQYCTIFTQAPGAYASTIQGPRVSFFANALDIDNAGYGMTFGPGFGSLSGCLLYGKTDNWGLAVNLSGGFLDVRYSALRAAPAMSSAVPLLAVWNGEAELSDVSFDGGGGAKGLSAGSPYGSSPQVSINSGCVLDNCSTALEATAQSRVTSVSSPTGTGNTTGVKIATGAQVQTASLAGLAATNESEIDGIVHPYTDLGTAGDYIVGQYGSKIART